MSNTTNILRLFLDNPCDEFTIRDISVRLNIHNRTVWSHLLDLRFQRMVIDDQGHPNKFRLHDNMKN